MLSSYVIQKSRNVSHNLLNIEGPNIDISYFTFESLHSCAYECSAYHRVPSEVTSSLFGMAFILPSESLSCCDQT